MYTNPLYNDIYSKYKSFLSYFNYLWYKTTFSHIKCRMVNIDANIGKDIDSIVHAIFSVKTFHHVGR